MKEKCFLLGLLSVILVIFSGCSSKQQSRYELKSPDGNIELVFNTENNIPVYSINYKSQEVILPSSLGMDMANDGLISDQLKIEKVSEKYVEEDYPVYAGKTDQVKTAYNQLTVALIERCDSPRKMSVIFRVYDDGVAFRYIVPNQRNIDKYHLKQEFTQFKLPESTDCWMLSLGRYTSSYEAHFIRCEPGQINVKDIIGLPLTFKIGDQIAGAIAEADLTNYAGMYLHEDPRDSAALVSSLSPRLDYKSLAVMAAKELISPWRVIMLGDNESELIKSNIITNLNDPCVIENPSWIKPGKCAWDWWNHQKVPDDIGFEGGMNNATMKYFIDFAAEYNLEYFLIDAGWYGDHRNPNEDITTCIPEIDMKALVEYGSKKNVDILVWVNWKSLDNQMEDAMALYEKWGIKGIKIDYMNRDDQKMVDFYHRTLQKAAKHKLLIDFHGAYKPTGIRRTYPNMMTREGIYGLEMSRGGTNVTPEHNVTIPFTRMLLGPMDYTPGGFLNVKRKDYIPGNHPPTVFGTRAHQLAMYVVYESPLQMVSDWPGAYRGTKGGEFLKSVPASWDKTITIDGKIGDYIILARKSGQKWYMGAMSDWKEDDYPVIPEKNFVTEDEGNKGLTGKYFKGKNFDVLVKTQTDKNIDFNWGQSGPEKLPGDYYSIQWTGKVKTDDPGVYDFYTSSDDGVRLWVNNKLIIDDWVKHGTLSNYASIRLEGGKSYPIKLEYFEDIGGANVKLGWAPPENISDNKEVFYRVHDIALDFLDKEKKYKAIIYKDSEKTINDPTILVKEKIIVSAEDKLKIAMVGGGGMAVEFIPEN